VSEHLPHRQDDDDVGAAAAAEPAAPCSELGGEEPVEVTGHPLVDEVLRSTQGLEDRPVEEHVAVFEAAHDKLRAALSDAGGRPDGHTSVG
jgi:hypothetical protein